MATTSDYLNQLKIDKQTLINNLAEKGVTVSGNETFTTLVPKVSDIGSGVDIYDYFVDKTTSTSVILQHCIKQVPLIDTSNATSMSGMFSNFSSLESIALLDTSKVTNMYNMFYNCAKLKNVPTLNTSKVTNMQGMFSSCVALTTSPQLDTSSVTNMSSMFNLCSSLEEIAQYDTSNVTNMYAFCMYCSKLKNVPLLDLGKVNNTSNMFGSCSNLVDLGGLKDLGKAYTQKTTNYSSYQLGLSSTNLTHESLMNVINNLYDLNLTYNVANGGTLYRQKILLGSTNLAKLTNEEIDVAYTKGWNIS